MVHGRGKRDVVVAFGSDGQGWAEGSGAEGSFGLAQEKVVGSFLVVVAARVVIAEGSVDGSAGEGLVELCQDEGCCLCREGGQILWSGPGREPEEAAREVMGEQIAGKGDEQGAGLGVVGSHKGGLQERPRRIEGRGVAACLQRLQIGWLRGGWRGVEDGGPLVDRLGTKMGGFGGIVKGIEMDIGQHDDRDRGLGRAWRAEDGDNGQQSAENGLGEAHRTGFQMQARCRGGPVKHRVRSAELFLRGRVPVCLEQACCAAQEASFRGAI